MNNKFKNFKDLEFDKCLFGFGKQAVMHFENGYWVSVLLGSMFYSNGRDSYEVRVFNGDRRIDETIINDGMLGWLTSDEVDEVMAKVQKLK